MKNTYVTKARFKFVISKKIYIKVHLSTDTTVIRIFLVIFTDYHVKNETILRSIILTL